MLLCCHEQLSHPAMMRLGRGPVGPPEAFETAARNSSDAQLFATPWRRTCMYFYEPSAITPHSCSADRPRYDNLDGEHSQHGARDVRSAGIA